MWIESEGFWLVTWRRIYLLLLMMVVRVCDVIEEGSFMMVDGCRMWFLLVVSLVGLVDSNWTLVIVSWVTKRSLVWGLLSTKIVLGVEKKPKRWGDIKEEIEGFGNKISLVFEWWQAWWSLGMWLKFIQWRRGLGLRWLMIEKEKGQPWIYNDCL